MTTITDWLLYELLQCRSLDLHFFECLVSRYDPVEFLDEVYLYWGAEESLTLNHLIYVAFEKIRQDFLSEKCDELEHLTESPDVFELEYDIHANCLDSSLQFKDDAVQSLYEDWYYYNTTTF